MLKTPFISSDAITILKQKSTAPDRVFILSRILFLATASGTSYIQTMVETKHHGRTLVEILGNKLDTMTTAVRNGTPNAKEAVTEDPTMPVGSANIADPSVINVEPTQEHILNGPTIPSIQKELDVTSRAVPSTGKDTTHSEATQPTAGEPKMQKSKSGSSTDENSKSHKSGFMHRLKEKLTHKK